MSIPAPPKWFFEADYIQACNCDYGCPCEFAAPPSRGFCEGITVWSITRGNYNGVALDGLGLALVVHWPGAIHQGNGTVCALIDERATHAQRNALLDIVSGKPGGMPFELVATTFTKVLEPQFLPFDFQINGRTGSVNVGGALTATLSPIKNPVTGEPESVRLEHATGFIFKEAECVAADSLNVSAGELNFSCEKKAGFITRIKYSN